MKTITYSEFRSDLKESFETVVKTHKPIMIASQSRDNCVLIPEKIYLELANYYLARFNEMERLSHVQRGALALK